MQANPICYHPRYCVQWSANAAAPQISQVAHLTTHGSSRFEPLQMCRTTSGLDEVMQHPQPCLFLLNNVQSMYQENVLESHHG
jgi:hypothetical protein